MFKKLIVLMMAVVVVLAVFAKKPLTAFVHPFLGTATIWDSIDIGYKPTHRTWGAEVFPGASLPNAMVQVSPVTMFHSGAGYQYEDSVIYGFTHTCKGHWNLCHVPVLPANGSFFPGDYASRYRHSAESAHPGYYQVYLERYRVNAELTSTLRCAFHRYTYENPTGKKVIFDLSRANEQVQGWSLEQEGDNVLKGYQHAGEKIYFYAVADQPVISIEKQKEGDHEMSVVNIGGTASLIQLRIGFSFVSIENAKLNLEKEIAEKSFGQVCKEASQIWEKLLSKIKISGGTARQQHLFYSTFYRSFLWPALRSDVNGDFTDVKGNVVNEGFDYYTEPSLWDDYRNKLILLGMVSPDVTVNVIKSLIDKGEKSGGFMPTFFHGDHAAPFVTGSYLRGIRGFDVKKAYNLLLRNATLENPSRPHILEYIAKGYIPEMDIANPKVETVGTAGVTKTLEYAYDDYAVALLAKTLNDTANYRMLMKRTKNYRNFFDASTGLMRGRLENGEFIRNFDPYFPYYEYMYREANAWQSSFFAPHDVSGLIGLYKNRDEFEKKLDDLFSIPWKGVEAYNISGFIGQYCHGNQPDHSFPWLYTFIGRQEKTQVILDSIMNHFYDMGKYHLSYAGMDDAGENSSWFVLTSIGLYPFSPADPSYIVSVPLFDKVKLNLSGRNVVIIKINRGRKIDNIVCGNEKVEGFSISHDNLLKCKKLIINTK